MSTHIRQILDQGKQELTNYPNVEAEQLLMILFQELFDISRTTFVAYPDTKLSNFEYNQIADCIQRLKNNEPIQYILGVADFYDEKFNVNPSVLIPRPETEELVDWIISDNRKKNPVITDVGTGSGCIAVSLSKNIIGSTVYAIDVSKEALTVAKSNAELNSTDLKIIECNILNAESERFLPANIDILVSNPPYVTQVQKKLMHNNVLKYEPDLALFVSDDDPLIFYRRIAELGLIRLVSGGSLYFEINEDLGNETLQLVQDMGYQNIVLKKDINGKDRMLKAIKV